MQNDELYNACIERSKIKLKKYLFDTSSVVIPHSSILGTTGPATNTGNRVQVNARPKKATLISTLTSKSSILENAEPVAKNRNRIQKHSNPNKVASVSVTMPPSPISDKTEFKIESTHKHSTQAYVNSRKVSHSSTYRPPSPTLDKAEFTTESAPKHYIHPHANSEKIVHTSIYWPPSPVSEKSELIAEVISRNSIKTRVNTSKLSLTSVDGQPKTLFDKFMCKTEVTPMHSTQPHADSSKAAPALSTIHNSVVDTTKIASKSRYNFQLHASLSKTTSASAAIPPSSTLEKAEVSVNLNDRIQSHANLNKATPAPVAMPPTPASGKTSLVETPRDNTLTQSNTSKVKFYDLPPVPDLLNHNMKILFINHNPDIYSSKKGRHFGNPTNTFWELLFKSGLVSTKLTCKDDKKLLEEYGFGFTYLCSRPTEWITELSKEELMEGVPILRQKIQEYKPQVCCFLGLTTYKYFTGKPSIQRKSGFQNTSSSKSLNCKIFVTKSFNRLGTKCGIEEKLNQMKALKLCINMKC